MLNASIKGSTQEELEDKVSDISGSEKQKSRDGFTNSELKLHIEFHFFDHQAVNHKMQTRKSI